MSTNQINELSHKIRNKPCFIVPRTSMDNLSRATLFSKTPTLDIARASMYEVTSNRILSQLLPLGKSLIFNTILFESNKFYK